MNNNTMTHGEMLRVLGEDESPYTVATKTITDRLLIDFNTMTRNARTKLEFLQACNDLNSRWLNVCNIYEELDRDAFKKTCHKFVPKIADDLPLGV